MRIPIDLLTATRGLEGIQLDLRTVVTVNGRSYCVRRRAALTDLAQEISLTGGVCLDDGRDGPVFVRLQLTVCDGEAGAA